MNKRIWITVLIISIVMIIISGTRIYQLSREYDQGIKEYANLEQYVSITDTDNTANAGDTEVADTDTSDVTEAAGPDYSLKIEADYEALKAINADYMGWIYYEPLELSYPLVRGNDNTYYTTHTFEGTENSSGSIFLDCINKPDFSDYNTIIYGHNMRNGTMFGSLKKGLTDTSIFEENPYFYILTDGKIMRYQIFACYVTNENSDTYTIVRDEDAQKTYLEYIDGVAEYRSDVEVTPQDKVVTLSTCHGLHSTNRTVVHGVYVDEQVLQ